MKRDKCALKSEQEDLPLCAVLLETGEREMLAEDDSFATRTGVAERQGVAISPTEAIVYAVETCNDLSNTGV